MNMPSYLASEISSKLLSADPRLRELFAIDSLPLSGNELEKMLQAVWLAGYCEAISDIARGPGPFPNKMPEFAEAVATYLN